MAEAGAREDERLLECDTCTVPQGKAQAYCLQCDAFICEECLTSHKVMRKFSFHTVSSLTDMEQDLAEERATISHTESTNKTTPNIKKLLQEKVSMLKQLAAGNSQAIENVETAKLQVESQTQCTTDTITGDFHRLRQILGKTEISLLREILRNVQVKKDEEPSKLENNTGQVENADIGVEVKCAEALQQLCQTKANIAQLAVDPAKCTVRGEGRETAEVGKTAEVTLTTKLTNNKTTRHSVAVVSELKSLRDGSVVKCTVNQSGPGEYNIKCTPTVRGYHKLTVSVDGQQVGGSPFSVSVSISPTQLGKPVKVWTGISFPYGVTVNSEGEVIVCEYQGDIIKLDKEGKKHVIVQHSSTTLSRLSDVATDKEDNIYCTDWDTNKVLRCDKNGRNVHVYKLQQVKGPGHYGVAVVRDEVMLCERGSKGTIMIYNRELEYVRRIVHEDMGQFYNLSSDSQGNLYVINMSKSMIRVFSNDGVLLRSFGGDDNDMNRLNYPWGVCVSGQYVYISDYGGHKVSVFTTAGRYVTSFGQEGREEGEFNCQRGICADLQHNLIVVCDYYNNRVQCFNVFI